jgi:hypothetical protein
MDDPGQFLRELSREVCVLRGISKGIANACVALNAGPNG